VIIRQVCFRFGVDGLLKKRPTSFEFAYNDSVNEHDSDLDYLNFGDFGIPV